MRELPENRQLSLNFCGYGRHFIAQPQIDGDVLPPTPIVLEIRPHDCLAKAPLRTRAGYSWGQEKRMICQKVGERVEGKDPIGIRSRQDVVPDSFPPAPEFPGVTAPGKRNVVIGLNRGPVEMVASYSAQTTHESSEPRDHNTGSIWARHGSEGRVPSEKVSTCERQASGRAPAIDSRVETSQ